MRIIAKGTLRRYWERFPNTQNSLQGWYHEVKRANWESPADVKAKYIKASILQSGRVVFNIRGNEHRLVVRINYRKQVVYIRFIGTHREYNMIDANEV